MIRYACSDSCACVPLLAPGSTSFHVTAKDASASSLASSSTVAAAPLCTLVRAGESDLRITNMPSRFLKGDLRVLTKVQASVLRAHDRRRHLDVGKERTTVSAELCDDVG